MLPALVDRLACPWCGAGGLVLEVVDGDADVVRSGRLHCPQCGRETVIEEGIWHARGPSRPPWTAAQLLNQLPLTSRLYEATWRRRSLSLLSGRRFPVSEELAELALWCQPEPGQVAVDVACSEGLYARRLARSGAMVLAVDHALPFLRAVQRRAAQDGVVVAPVLAEAQSLPLLAGAVDLVVMGGSLNEIGDRRSAVAEMSRVVRVGGRGFSMSLVRARGRAGRALQQAARPGGIEAEPAEATIAAFDQVGLRAAASRLDGVVLRLDLAKAAGAVLTG